MKKITRVLAIIMASTLLMLSLSSCKKENNTDLIQFQDPIEGQKIATMTIKDLGVIKIMLFEDQAPKTVENFVKLSEKGYYDGIIFHRVIKNFMAQGGDPTGTGRGGESAFGKDFKDEFNDALRNFTGSLSMANAGPNTNGSQFFINCTPPVDKNQVASYKNKNNYSDEQIEKYAEVGGNFHLDNAHTVFGQVIEGLDVITKMYNVTKDSNDKPLTDIVIESVVITEYNK